MIFTVGAGPMGTQGGRHPRRLGAVGRIEVVALLEDVEREVSEHGPEALGDLRVEIRVAEGAQRQVYGGVESA